MTPRKRVIVVAALILGVACMLAGISVGILRHNQQESYSIRTHIEEAITVGATSINGGGGDCHFGGCDNAIYLDAWQAGHVEDVKDRIGGRIKQYNLKLICPAKHNKDAEGHIPPAIKDTDSSKRFFCNVARGDAYYAEIWFGEVGAGVNETAISGIVY